MIGTVLRKSFPMSRPIHCYQSPYRVGTILITQMSKTKAHGVITMYSISPAGEWQTQGSSRGKWSPYPLFIPNCPSEVLLITEAPGKGNKFNLEAIRYYHLATVGLHANHLTSQGLRFLSCKMMMAGQTYYRVNL